MQGCRVMREPGIPKLCHLPDPQQDGHSPHGPRRRKENVSAPGSTSPLAASTSQHAGKALRGGGVVFPGKLLPPCWAGREETLFTTFPKPFFNLFTG